MAQLLAGRQKFLLQCIQPPLVFCCPRLGLPQPHPPVQGIGVTFKLVAVPLLRCPRQAAVNLQPLAVSIQPAAQRLPLPNQRLVRHLHFVFIRCQQPRIRQPLHHRFRCSCLISCGQQFRLLHPPPRILRPLPQLRQPQENVAGNRLLLFRQRGKGGFGGLGNGTLHPACRPVPHVRQLPVPLPPPRLLQGMGKQRQAAWFLPHLIQHRRHQRWLKTQPLRRGWLLNSAAQFGAIHWPNIPLLPL